MGKKICGGEPLIPQADLSKENTAEDPADPTKVETSRVAKCLGRTAEPPVNSKREDKITSRRAPPWPRIPPRLLRPATVE